MQKSPVRRRWIITVAACILILAALVGFKVLQIRGVLAFVAALPEPAETVHAVTVEVRELHQQIDTLGTVVAPQSVELRNQLDGRVVAVHFRGGEAVSAGQVLLELDTREERAGLKGARARAELARLELERARKLRASRTVSQERLDQAQAQHQVALADIEMLEAQIDKKTLRAPFAAHTSLHQFEVGDFLPANSLITELVGSGEFVWVDFSLPIEQAHIGLGNRVQVYLPGVSGAAVESPAGPVGGELNGAVTDESAGATGEGSISAMAAVQDGVAVAGAGALRVAEPDDAAIEVRDDAAGELPNNAMVAGQIIAKNPALSARSRTLDYRARLPAHAQLPHNSLVNVRIEGSRARRLPVIPVTAYRIDQLGAFVYVLERGAGEEGHRAQRRAVVAGQRGGQTIAIESGLVGGELIATRGAFKLREGILANVAPASSSDGTGVAQ